MNRNALVFFLAMLTFFLPRPAFAQNVPHIHFGTDQGFDDRVIYNLLQDARGFYWLCTEEGVYRYDGRHFVQYTSKDGLGDNVNFNIFQDSKGGIWFSGFNGTVSYYRDGKFYNSLSNDWLLPMQGEQHAQIYGEHNGEVSFFEPKSKKTISVQLADEITGYKLVHFPFEGKPRCFYRDSNDYVFAMPKSIWRIDSTNSKEIFPINDSLIYIRRAAADTMLATSSTNKVYWLFDNGSVELIGDFDALGKLERVKYWGNWLLLFTKDSRLFVYDRSQKRFTSVLDGLMVTSAIFDNESTLVCATSGAGFYALHNLNAKKFPKDFKQAEEQAFGLHLSGDSIWVGYNKGVYCQRVAGEINSFRITAGNRRNVVKTISSIGDKTYIGSERRLRIVDSSGEVLDLNLRESGVGTLKDFSVMGDEIVVAGANGTALISNTGRLINRMDVNRGFSCKWIDKRTIYFTSSAGMFRFDRATEKSERIHIPLIDTSLTRVKEIEIFQDGVLLATDGDGALFLQNDSLKVINVAVGLSADFVSDIFIERENVYWVATNNGLNRVEVNGLDHRVTQKYFVSSGLPSNHVNRVVVKDDKIHVTTTKGYAVIPVEHKQHDFAIKVEFGDILVNGRSGIDLSDTILRPRDQIEIPFSFSSISHIQQVTFDYKERADEEFRPLQTSVLELIDLSGRVERYEYTVRASYLGQPVAGSENTIGFYLRPYWYNRTWVQLLTTASLLTFIFFWIYTGIRRRRVQRERELIYSTQLSQLEMQALRAQFNPHFVHNVLNAIQSFVIKNQPDEAYDYITRFSRLMRSYLVATDRNYITLSKEFEMMENYISLEQIRVPGKFDYSINVSPELSSKETEIPSMILQPFVENAINHGLVNSDVKGMLKLSAIRRNRHIIITIVDNGIGRDAASEISRNKEIKQKSYGVGIVADRLRLFKRLHEQEITIEIQDENPETKEGTRVTISIPETET